MNRRAISRFLLRGIGVVLLFLGVALGTTWFYFMGPLRNVIDPLWLEAHSEKRYWEEIETSTRRSVWNHDAFVLVGRFGNKDWVAWIMLRIHPGDDISDCAAGHKDEALKIMTNQEAGDSADAWLDWWAKNQSKSQEEWILEGFKLKGLELKTPLSKQNIHSLLRLIEQNKHIDKSGDHPLYRSLHWNAMRWLRDSDFNPTNFGRSDLPRENPDEVLRGLVEYSKLLGRFPKDSGLGVLPIGKPVETYDVPLPFILTREFKASVYGILILLVGGGIVCLFLASRQNASTN